MVESHNKLIVLVTGSNGLVGRNLKQLVTNLTTLKSDYTGANSALAGQLSALLIDEQAVFHFATRAEADLTSFDQTVALFKTVKPTHVLHTAARVGGLFANMAHKVQFWQENIAINDNVIRACH
jgi:GDP-L-fucose synthase